jgi:phosphonate transport system substrate-binding protein
MPADAVFDFDRIKRHDLKTGAKIKGRRSMKRLIYGAALAITLLSGVAIAQDKPAFVFTAIPDQDETRLVERFTRVADYLQGKLGVAVKYLPVKSYPAAVTAFTNNQVQLAWFGGFTGVQARREVPDSEAIAQGAEDVAFKSFVIANTKTGLKPSKEFPKEIAGKSFTFGSRGSTSGRLMPEYFIRKGFGGRNPEEVFSRVGFSGDHSRTIQLVQSGAYEIGVVDFTVWALDLKAGKADPSQVIVVWESPTFPDYQWTVRGDVDRTYGAGFKEKLRAALLAIDDPAILTPFARSKFIPAKNSDYAPIEEVAKAANLLN